MVIANPAQAERCITTDDENEVCGVFVSDKAQGPVVQTMHSAVHRINHCPADKHLQNQLSYPLDSDLSGGRCYPSFAQLGSDVQKRINITGLNS